MNDREAFDLFHPDCRRNVKSALKRGKWKKIWWLKMVIKDTVNRVCSKGGIEK